MMPPDLPSQRRKILNLVLVPREKRQVSRAQRQRPDSRGDTSRAQPRGRGDGAGLEFLVDDGVTCPPDLAQTGRRSLPVRNCLGRVGANRRLVQKTGEFGRVQV